MEKASFAAGCFWHVEDLFSKVPGIFKTEVGYIGGHTINPSYDDVCADLTHHAEAVLLEFEPAKVTYDHLLDIFWELHDPTTLNRQGPDIGSQYRSAIFCYSNDQLIAAQNSKMKWQSSGRIQGTIVTEILMAPDFYPAELYHQKYLAKKRGSCSVDTKF